MTRDPEAQAADRRTSKIVVGVAFLLTLAFFWPTLRSLTALWAQDGRSHGWVVVALVGWLVWRERRQLLSGLGGTTLALLPLVALSLFWFCATVAHVQVAHQAALVFLVVFWGLAVFGRRAFRILLAAGGTSLLALPLLDGLVPVLRPLTALASGALVRVLGIPAEIGWDVVRIPAGLFLINGGCAGLSFLLAGLVVGAFYALALVRGWPSQLAVIGLSGVISIVGNWVRVAALIVIGHITDMQSGLMEDHGWFGWLVFAVGLVPFFFLAGVIQKRSLRRSVGVSLEAVRVEDPPLSDTLRPSGQQLPDARTWGMGDGFVALAKRTVAATALALVGPVVYFVVGALPPVPTGDEGLKELAAGDQWLIAESSSEPSFGWRPGYHGAEYHQSLGFTDGSAYVHGDRFVFIKQAQGAKLVGFPNQIAPRGDILDERLVGPVDPMGRLWIRQAVVRGADGPVLVWYWYRVGGVDTFSPVHAKLLEIPAFLGRLRASELFALGVACEPDNCRLAFQALGGFMGARAFGVSGDPPR